MVVVPTGVAPGLSQNLSSGHRTPIRSRESGDTMGPGRRKAKEKGIVLSRDGSSVPEFSVQVLGPCPWSFAWGSPRGFEGVPAAPRPWHKDRALAGALPSTG